MEKKQKQSKSISPKVKLFIFRYYKIITTLIILLLVISSYYLILQPKYQEINLGGKYDLFNLEQEILSKNDYLTSLQALNDSYANVSSKDRARLERVLPTESDIPGLLVQLEALAKSEGVLLSSLSFREVPKAVKPVRRSSRKVQPEPDEDFMSKLNKVTIDMNLLSISEKGDYEKVKSFLTAIENNLRLFDVNAVFYSPDSSNFSISLITYYLN